MQELSILNQEKIVLHSLKLNVRVFTRYISSKNNRNVDLLSRLKVKMFKKENPNSDVEPTLIPHELWPLDKIWQS